MLFTTTKYATNGMQVTLKAFGFNEYKVKTWIESLVHLHRSIPMVVQDDSDSTMDDDFGLRHDTDKNVLLSLRHYLLTLRYMAGGGFTITCDSYPVARARGGKSGGVKITACDGWGAETPTSGNFAL
uniref:Uncharacterized protein n=1 Tax=Romanomermis culicivorax TaxID=13658 RepID=A0A915JDV6_ROMCU